jgi:cell division protein ZapA
MSSVKPEPPAAESVKVNIFGQTYSLRSPRGGERIRRLAGLVDERMREIASQLAVHDAAKVAVLAALNLADEMELVREHYEREIESLLTRGPEPGAESYDPSTTESTPAAVTDAALDPSAGARDQPEAGAVRGAGPAADEVPASAGETKAGDESAARRSWFDEIFDTEFSPGGGPGRLSSQVSSRLQRLRQATREGTISDGETRED